MEYQTEEYNNDDYDDTDYDDERLFEYQDPRDSQEESQDDTEDENEDEDDEDNKNDGHQEFLFQCAARYKGGIICKKVFENEQDIFAHLNQTHYTNKWLVHEFVKIQH